MSASEKTSVTLRRLNSVDHGDFAALQSVIEGAPAYWLKVSGELPTANAARETFEALPPGKTYDDKFVFGIYFGTEIIGCVDLIDGFPNSSTAMLGLLLLRESHQKQGLGKQAYHAVEQFIAGRPHLTAVRIGVIATNEIAFPFWRSLGFVENGIRSPYNEGSIVSENIVLEKSIN